MSFETSKNLSTGSAEVAVQATLPSGQQQSLDLLTGTTGTSMNKGIGGSALLHAGGGVCISHAW
jgi:hypothetical protein